MRYPIVIEPREGDQAYGVVVPDLPGCFSAGDTLDEAFAEAQEAAIGWIETELDEGHDIPQPSPMEVVVANPDYKGWIFGCIDVPSEPLSAKTECISITLPQCVLHRLDALAKAAGDSRSDYIAWLVMEKYAAIKSCTDSVSVAATKEPPAFPPTAPSESFSADADHPRRLHPGA